jgi:hypothetical protein
MPLGVLVSGNVYMETKTGIMSGRQKGKPTHEEMKRRNTKGVYKKAADINLYWFV